MLIDLMLALLLAVISTIVAVIQGVQHSVFGLITVYWLVLATKNWLLLKKGRRKHDKPR